MAAAPVQLTSFDRYMEDGFVLVKNLFSPTECDSFVALMAENKQAQQDFHLSGGDWAAAPPPRTRKPGERDPELSMALDPRLREPLRTLMSLDGWTDATVEPEMIQAMYFWQGSTQERHQDAFYLPECTSMWMPLEDVSPRNGMHALVSNN
eukprot:SAG31_NODE_16176_length_720_cov_0.760064_2_plen_151_part_00